MIEIIFVAWSHPWNVVSFNSRHILIWPQLGFKENNEACKIQS